MTKLIRAALVLVLAVSLLAGCQAAPEPPAPTVEGQGMLQLTEGRVLETLNHHQYAASATARFLGLVVGTLYRYVPSEDGTTYRLIPELAAGDPVMMDDDGLAWQIKVSPDARWANGEPITAADFVYSWQMLLDPKLVNHRAPNFKTANFNVVNNEEYFRGEAAWEDVGIKLLDDETIEVELSVPVNDFVLKNALSYVTYAPVYKALYEAGMNEDRTDTDYGISPDKMMSSGPFVVSAWQGDAEYTAVKNPEYLFAESIWLAGINYRVIPEAGTVMQMFETGQVDYVNLGAADYERFKEDPRIVSVPVVSVHRIVVNLINTEKPILGNLKFRRALFHAIDRAECARIANGLPANYIISTRYLADISKGLIYRDTPEAKAVLSPNLGHDLELAKQMFDEAMAEEGLDEITLQLAYHDGVESRKQCSEFIQKSVNDLFEGRLKLTLQAVPSSQLAASLRAYVDDHNSFELGWTGTSSNVFDPTAILIEFYGPQTRRKGPYANEEYDELWRTAAQTPLSEVQIRTERIAAAEAVILRDCPAIPVVQNVQHGMVASRVALPVKGHVERVGLGWIWARIEDQ